MEQFRWREAEGLPLPDRFRDLPGSRPWRDLVEEALSIDGGDVGARCRQLFDRFLEETSEPSRFPPPQRCCVFVSHRMADVVKAERIAKIVDHEGYDHWLDVHDPALARLNGASLPRPVLDLLIAAIIEIALLNATHVIAAHTKNSVGSKWIPYEFGRAKQRILKSSQAAGWFESAIVPSACGEYTLLAEETFSRDDIQRWLRNSTAQCQHDRATSRRSDDPPDADGL